MKATAHAAQTAQGWSDWLDEQPTSQQNHPKPATHAGSLDVATVSTVKPHKTTSTNPVPTYADVENDMNETGKEKAMQTAKQDKTIIDTDSTAQIDLRDAAAASVSSLKDSGKSLSDDKIGSLFGPAIEDDVKGVRQQIRELIQCEMQGELGQRFSRNLRIVIRREIAAAIDDQFDRV